MEIISNAGGSGKELLLPGGTGFIQREVPGGQGSFWGKKFSNLLKKDNFFFLLTLQMQRDQNEVMSPQV